jgi:hypothetical protein
VAAPIVAIVGVLALACVSGVLAVILPVLLLAARLTRTGRWLPPLAGLAFFAAGVVVAVQIGAYPASATGAFGVPAQVLSILALAAVLCSCVLDAPGWSSRRIDHDVDAMDPAPVRPRPATSDVFSGSDSR